MKKYNSRFYDDVDKALEDCNNHQDWNVINIYRTGWREEVGVVYYIRTDDLKQEWSEEDEYHRRQILRILKDNGCSQTLQEKTEKWIEERLKSISSQSQWKPSDEHYELEEFAKIVRGNLIGISEDVQEQFEAKYLQLTGNRMYGGFKD